MSSPPDPDRHPSPPTVPRDRQIDDDSDRPPSPADVNRRDEDDTDADKPLLADSRAARALHERPPRTQGELQVGSAGDAARPTKPGVHNKPVPPRGRL